MKDAIQSLRSLFLTTLLIFLLWFLTWPNALDQLAAYRNASELHSWLLLRDTLRAFELPLQVSDFDPDENIDEVLVGNIEESWEPIQITVGPGESAGIVLKPHRFNMEPWANGFRFYTLDEAPPSASYLLGFYNEEMWIVPDDGEGLESIEGVTFENLLSETWGNRQRAIALRRWNGPRHWDELRPRLRQMGIAPNLDSLESVSDEM